MQNTCPKYADTCIYVVNVVVCTETYFMLQICTYWYINDTYIWSILVNCGLYSFMSTSISS